jgi:hypothetical protein
LDVTPQARTTLGKGLTPLEPIIQTEQLTHIYSAGTPFERTALEGVRRAYDETNLGRPEAPMPIDET